MSTVHKKRNIARMVILENIFVLNSTLHGAVNNMISKCTFLQRTSIGVLPLKIPASHFPFIDWLLHFCSTCSTLNNSIKDAFSNLWTGYTDTCLTRSQRKRTSPCLFFLRFAVWFPCSCLLNACLFAPEF